MTKVQRLIALIVVILLLGFGVVFIIIRTTMRPIKSYWTEVGSWSLNIVGASTIPVTLQYLIIGHNEPPLFKYLLFWNNKYLKVSDGPSIMTHQRSNDVLYNMYIQSTLKNSFKEKNLSLTLKTNLWNKTLPYGEASVKLVSNPVNWLYQLWDYGGTQGAYRSHHRYYLSLKNNSHTSVRILGLVQSGNYTIEKMQYIMPSPINTIMTKLSHGNPFPKGGVLLTPGKSIMLYCIISINSNLYRNIYFDPGISLVKNKIHGIQLVPATTWITYFG